jgi:HPt (histidine-containing phosphotransfer) domain-containing protein
MGLDMYLEKRRANSEEYEEIAYWRKANQIREWFNSHLENGVANCEYVQVSKEDLEQLLEDCKKVLKDHTLAEDLLPTSSGFFFGSTDYDEEYFEALEDTVKRLEQVLEETDFENEDVYYSEWW